MLVLDARKVRQLAYTQPPPMTKEEIESLLKEAKTARFCSINRDGTIHAVPVSYKYESGRIILFTPEMSRKAKNIRRSKRATVLVDISEGPGWQRGVMIDGEAKIETDYDSVMPHMVSTWERYMKKERAVAYADGLFKLAKWVMITVTPDRIASFDYSKDEAHKAIIPK